MKVSPQVDTSTTNNNNNKDKDKDNNNKNNKENNNNKKKKKNDNNKQNVKKKLTTTTCSTTTPKIIPISPKSNSGSIREAQQQQQQAIILTEEEIILFLKVLQLECTVKPLKRKKEQDPRVQAFFTFKNVSLEDVDKLPNFLNVFQVICPDSTTTTRSDEHEQYVTTLSILRSFLDVSMDLIKSDNVEVTTSSDSRMTIANQSISLVDIIFEKVIDYINLSTSKSIIIKLPDIFKSLYSLWSVIELVDVNSKVLWGQALTRASALLVACSCHEESCQEDTLTYLVTGVQALSQCITVFRDICGFPVSTSATMQFWPICHYTLYCVSQALVRGLLRESVAKSMASNVYRALASSAPSPQELPALIHTLNTAYPSTSSNNYMIITNGQNTNENGNIMNDDNAKQKRRLSSVSEGWSRVVFVLTGFQYLLHESLDVGILRQQLTRPAEWLTAIGEALLICITPTSPRCLKPLAYTLAQYFFFVVMACHRHKKLSNMKDVEWLFSELSEHLQKYSNMWNKKQKYITKLKNISESSIQNKLSGRPPSSQSNAANRTSPVTGVSKKSVGLPQLQNNHSPCDILHSVGDKVEGLCAVRNGSKRWFPGVITKANPVTSDQNIVTYNVKFNDGDEKEGLTNNDVRVKRSRTSRRGLSRNNSSKSLKSTGEELVSLSEMGPSEEHSSQDPASKVIPSRMSSSSAQQDRHVHLTYPPPITEPLTDRFEPMEMSGDDDIKVINSTDMDNEGRGFDNDDVENTIFEIPLVLPRSESPLFNTVSAGNSINGESVYSGIHFENTDNDGEYNINARLKPGVVVPRMPLERLDSGAALDRCVSTNSLSGALLKDNKNEADEDTGSSPRTAVDKILNDIGMDDSTAATKLDSWRDSVGWNTRRSTERPNGPKSSSASSLLSMAHNQLAQSQELQRVITLATTDLQAELSAMSKMADTFEVIAAVLSFKTVLDLAMFEKEALFPVKTVSKETAQPDPYEDNTNQRDILMRPELNSGQYKLYMYAVREFLDSGASDKQVPFLSMSASEVGPCYFRLLKLCSTRFFENSCLPSHLSESDKIGTGAFGSVHRVICQVSCASHIGPRNHDAEYAVKRMPRERSLQDESVLFGVLMEVTCMEIMADHRGVCDIINYGVYSGQYWMVLELGMCNVLEWTLELINQESLLDSISKSDQVNSELKFPDSAPVAIDNFLLKLCMFYEMSSILHDIHKKNIIHFDLKCSNFMLRRCPNLDDFVHVIDENKSSGVLFLTDFGESLQSSEDIDLKLKQRSRGTLAIQSPEMLSVSESGTGLANSMKLGVQSTEEETINTPGIPSDCWSIGCALFELMTGSCLFDGISFTEMFCLLCRENFQLPDIAANLTSKGMRPESVPTIESCATAVADLITLELVQSPLTRPPLTQLMAATNSLIKTLMPFRSKQSYGNFSGGCVKQDSYSPFYHLADSSPFKVALETESPNRIDPDGKAPPLISEDFLDVKNTSCAAPPLARDYSNGCLQVERSISNSIPQSCPQDAVHVSPGAWQFCNLVTLDISNSFSANMPNSKAPVDLDDVYGDMNRKISSIIKMSTTDEGIDAIELQSKLSEQNDVMKKSLLQCLGHQFDYVLTPHKSPMKQTKVCHVNLYMSEPEIATVSSKPPGGIATTTLEVPSVSALCVSTALNTVTETSLFETDNLCIYPCEILKDINSTVEILKRAFAYAKKKYRDGFHVQFCLESFVNPASVTKEPRYAYAQTIKDKISVSKSATTAAVLLSTLLRLEPTCVKAAENSLPPLGASIHDAYDVEDVHTDPVVYLDKHYPWLLTILDRRLFHTLREKLHNPS